MIALIILGIIAAIIALIMLIPIGADIGYEGGQLTISAKAAGVLIRLFPKSPEDRSKPKKEKKPKEPPKKPEEENKPKKPKKKLKLEFTKEELLELVKKVLSGFGIFGRKLRVDRFLLHYVAAGDDPYKTAVMFGYVNAALDILAPICSQRFTVDDLDVRTDCDFTADKMKIDFGIAMTIRIGAIFRMVFAILFGALGILIKNKIRLAIEKKRAARAAKNEKTTEDSEENEITDDCVQQDERMNENGE